MTERRADGPLFVLLGPTASGKEAAAVYAARLLGAELIVCDSVKPYRGLEIAAAAPPPAHTELVPHHLVGVLDPRERLHAARWVALAEEAVANVRDRGLVPLVVGGTALYLKALLFGLLAGPPADAALRARLSADERAAPGALHTRLTQVDPVAAARIHPNDRKRLLRALEVFAATGTPISERQGQWAAGTSVPHRAVGLRRTRDDLRARIVARVDRMLAAGLVDEIAALSEEGRLGPTACEAIGVKEMLPLVRELAGRDGPPPPPSLAVVAEAIRAHTWQLARHQMTWFRRFPDVAWLDLAPNEPAEETGRRVAAALTAEA